MSIGNNAENFILNLIFNAAAWTGIAQNHGTPDTNVDVALSTATVADTGTMSTTETTYASYARVSRTRTNASGGWAASTVGSISPHTTAITFPAGTVGAGDTVNSFSVGKTGGGGVDFFWSGSVSPTIATGNGVTPSLTIATTITLD